jgi:hypothetical protein
MKKYILFEIGSVVQWRWMGCTIVGSVKEIYTEPVAKIIKGKMIKRNGSEENPAFLVYSKAGNYALKLQSELKEGELIKSRAVRPKMFSS